MNSTLTGCTRFDDEKIKKLNSRISKLEQLITQNTKDAKKLAWQISKYVADNLTTIFNAYDDNDYKKYLKDINKLQISIFSDLEKFDNHDQATIQD